MSCYFKTNIRIFTVFSFLIIYVNRTPVTFYTLVIVSNHEIGIIRTKINSFIKINKTMLVAARKIIIAKIKERFDMIMTAAIFQFFQGFGL